VGDLVPYLGVLVALLNTVYVAGVLVQRVQHLEKRADGKEAHDEGRDKTLTEIQITLARVDGRLAALSSKKTFPF
jgi:hypothetical protein